MLFKELNVAHLS